MKCEKYLDLIDDFVEGELDARAAEPVNLHIFACDKCALRYETLKREKEIYAHYLFDVEPSGDLSAKFQVRLKNETNQTSRGVQKSADAFGWKTKLTNFWRLSPVLASAILLLVIGFGLSKLVRREKAAIDEMTAKTDSANTQTSAEAGDITEDKTPDSIIKTVGEKKSDYIKVVKNNDTKKPLYKPKNVSANNKFVAAVEVKNEKKTISGKPKQDSLVKIKLTEQQRQILLASSVEEETFKQIEKIELLLRSFRNARSIENTESFDVAYEKEQARKLLRRNAQLRQNAGNYGTFYTEELLDRAEPFLLEIANLGSDSSAEKVLEIKDRVKNQNIIASLQIYK